MRLLGTVELAVRQVDVYILEDDGKTSDSVNWVSVCWLCLAAVLNNRDLAAYSSDMLFSWLGATVNCLRILFVTSSNEMKSLTLNPKLILNLEGFVYLLLSSNPLIAKWERRGEGPRDDGLQSPRARGRWDPV